MNSKTPSLAPVYLICGPEAFLRREAIQRVVAAALEGQEDALGRSVIDGDRASLADVLDEVRTLSLLGDRRVVVVEDADDFLEKSFVESQARGKSKPKERKYRDKLEEYCADPSDTGVLVLVTEGADSRTRFYKAVDRLGGVVRCEAMNRQAVSGWITDRAAKAYRKRVSGPAANRLKDLVGDSLGLLDQELDKLATYVGARPEITVEDVDALVGNNRERTVFAISDAIADGDAATALRQWERVLATDRAAPGRAIGGLAWGVRKLMDAHDALAAGASIQGLAAKFYSDANQLKRRLQVMTRRRLEDQLCDLLQADLGSKTGLTGVDRAIEKFIVKHTLVAKGIAAGG